MMAVLVSYPLAGMVRTGGDYRIPLDCDPIDLATMIWIKLHARVGGIVDMRATCFNARAERGSAFGQKFFVNGKLWLALGALVGLQVASSVLFLEEARKQLLKVIFRG